MKNNEENTDRYLINNETYQALKDLREINEDFICIDHVLELMILVNDNHEVIDDSICATLYLMSKLFRSLK